MMPALKPANKVPITTVALFNRMSSGERSGKETLAAETAEMAPALSPLAFTFIHQGENRKVKTVPKFMPNSTCWVSIRWVHLWPTVAQI